MTKAAIFAVRKQEQCPECSAPLVIRSGKHGPFAGCSAYPVCEYIRPLHSQVEGKLVKVLEGVTCPLCGADKALRQGRYGMFVGCSAYPECEHTETIDQPEQTDISCPQCQQGHIIQRRSRYGKIFFACSEYPRCQLTLNHQPIAQTCPHCQFPLLIEKKYAHEIKRFCANKQCALQVEICHHN